VWSTSFSSPVEKGYGCPACETAFLHRTATLPACLMQDFHLDDDKSLKRPPELLARSSLASGREAPRIPMRPTKQSAARRVRGLQTDFRRVSFRKTPPTTSPAFPLGAFSFLGLVTPNYRTLNSEFMQDFRLLNAEMAGACCEKRLLFKLLAGGD
jgi:hypothetical protein